ncbi:hypothetical protein L7F22_056789 [Adiantum nelumboides]|nr:hypothetical protein [Adiantum nelumboides]
MLAASVALNSGPSKQRRSLPACESEMVHMATSSSRMMNAYGCTCNKMGIITQIFWVYFAGFRDACCVHRAYFFCRRSQKVFLRTVQCFLLNGFIFLGIYFFIEKLVAPIVHRILAFPFGEKQHIGSPVIETYLLYLCQGLLVLPLYGLSYVASCIWYNEIARNAFIVLEGNTYDDNKANPQQMQTSQRKGNQSASGLDGMLFSAGEQTYSVLMLLIFYFEVRAATAVPYLGKFLLFPLRSWLYAYYFFDYAWGYAKWSLEKRLMFFETNWAFFAGFGSPCVLATLPLTGLVQDGVLAFLFPLFVLVAFGSHPEKVVAGYSVPKSQMPRIPIFYLISVLMNKLFLTSKMAYELFGRVTHTKQEA